MMTSQFLAKNTDNGKRSTDSVSSSQSTPKRLKFSIVDLIDKSDQSTSSTNRFDSARSSASNPIKNDVLRPFTNDKEYHERETQEAFDDSLDCNNHNGDCHPDVGDIGGIGDRLDDRDEDESIEAVDSSDNDSPPAGTPAGDSRFMQSADCRLEGSEVWVDFHRLGTEMIITKSGRRMFPLIKCAFSGCERDVRYAVYIDVVPTDCKRYRYAYHKSSWLVAGKADPPPPPRLYLHPDSPFTGEMIVKQVISFEKLKLTNNEMDKNGHVILNSMHKYQPRIHLVRLSSQSFVQAANTTELSADSFKTFVFKETQFTAVTAYQNQLITKMKIERNPFAKGFRDSSRLHDYDGRESSLYDYHRMAAFSQSPAMNFMKMWQMNAAFMLHAQGLLSSTLNGSAEGNGSEPSGHLDTNVESASVKSTSSINQSESEEANTEPLKSASPIKSELVDTN